jgi:phosphoribulokinase
MSKKHPVVAVTGSSGAGTTTVKRAFEHIFYRDGIKPAVVEGDSFHRFSRVEMREKIADGLSHFGPEANHFAKISDLFKAYGETGTGEKRYYLHSPEEAAEQNARLGCDKKPGEFTPWEKIEDGTDLLFYEGLHGMVIDGEVDVAKYVDLGVGVVPIVNLEWIQKIFRDNAERGYSEEAIVDTIMRRMPDYINHVTP